MVADQRWNHRRATFVVPPQTFNPKAHRVAIIEDDTTARDFVETHHYSGSYPAARARVGLYRRERWRADPLVGVAVFSVPMNQRTVGCWCRLDEQEDSPTLAPEEGILLGRFVLLDEVPFNAETWFLARAFKKLRAELDEVRVVLSYSDPVARTNAQGQRVFPGHIGTIYQAHNADYLGRATPRTLLLDPHGRVISDRLLSKIRGEERGIEHALARLREAGCPRRRALETGRAYVERVLRAGHLRRLKHPGNHLYRWSLDRRLELWPPPAPRRPRQVDPRQLQLI